MHIQSVKQVLLVYIVYGTRLEVGPLRCNFFYNTRGIFLPTLMELRRSYFVELLSTVRNVFQIDQSEGETFATYVVRVNIKYRYRYALYRYKYNFKISDGLLKNWNKILPRLRPLEILVLFKFYLVN